MANDERKVSVLFVCMGNICRSPTAEGVFRHFVTEAGLTDRILIDSAGTHAYHVGEPADRRAQKAAERRGYMMDRIRARRVCEDDFASFDHILAMDRDNLARLQAEAGTEQQSRIRLFLEYSSLREREVPDPYYGGAAGFERVLDMVEDASSGLLNFLRREYFRE